MTRSPAPTDDAPDPRVGAGSHAPLIVDRAAIDAVAAHVGGDTTVERGGVLVGDASASPLHITAAIRAERAISHPSALTFTHEAWDETNAALERDHPGLQIVGWYHSHPGFSVFLSEYDTFIHRNFFAAPWQVAYVVDPLLGEDGFFGWAGTDIVRYASWDVRTAPLRRDAAVAAPAVHRPAAHVSRPRLVTTIVAVGIAGVLGGFAAAQILDEDPVRPSPTTLAPGITAPPDSTAQSDPTASSAPPESSGSTTSIVTVDPSTSPAP